MSESGVTEEETADIILVATRTVDRVPRPGGGYREIPGGPATYVGQALRELGAPYRLITGKSAVVEVLQTDFGEQYLLPPLPYIRLPEILSARAIILSPIIQEIDPHGVPDLDGLLVVDLQGFVREPNSPSGSGTGQFELTSLLRRADVVKAAGDELLRLTEDSRRALDACVLLETHGSRGAMVSVDGRTRAIASRPVIAPDTIGAGDTYLAAFVVEIINGASPPRAAEAAARFTESWLCSAKGGSLQGSAAAVSEHPGGS